MSCDCPGIVYPSSKSASHAARAAHASRDALTGLPFAVLLLVFSAYLAFSPAEAVTPGVEVVTGSAIAVGDGFAQVADATLAETVDYVRTQVALSASVGETLALAGTAVGQGAHDALFAPSRFTSDMRQYGMLLSPAYAASDAQVADAGSWMPSAPAEEEPQVAAAIPTQ